MIKGLRGAGRRQARDIDYDHKLTTFDREWLSQFLHDLPRDHAADRDIMARYYPTGDMDDSLRMEGPETPSSASFPRYRCRECLKRNCSCGPGRNREYSLGDWIAEPWDPERIAEAAEELDPPPLAPVAGMAAEDLDPGVRVEICIPRHYLNAWPGTVRAYRVWTDEYLIESDRRGRAGQNQGGRSLTTFCWVSPNSLKPARKSYHASDE